MSDLRTLQVGLTWFPEGGGGLDRFYYELLEQLNSLDVPLRGLVVGSGMAAQQTAGRVEAFAATDAGLRTKLLAAPRAAGRALRELNANLVVSHFAFHAFPVLPLLGKRPLVIHFQGPWAQESRAEGESARTVLFKRGVERLVYRRARRLIVLSEAFRDILHQDYGVPLSRIRVIPGAVDVRRYDTGVSRAEARRQLGWDEQRPTILIVRRLASRMGLEDAIMAMEQVRVNFPQAQLLIAGRGRLAAELQRLISERQLQDHVRLLGFVPDELLPLTYRATDFSLVPTVSLEGFGLITVESLASGTPVLVTPVGGLPEVVRGLSSELVLPTTGPQAIAAALVGVLSGRVVLPDAAACMEYARTQYDWPVIVDRILAVYQEALS